MGHPDLKNPSLLAGVFVLPERHLLVGLFEFRDDAEVFECCGVAFYFAVGCQFAEEASHDFS